MIRRAMLFMPGDDRRKIEKGAALAVDSIIMDLEDGVALSQKAAGRQTIVQALGEVDFGDSEKLVRINPIDSDLWQADLAAVADANPYGFVIPKVESAAQLAAVNNWLDAKDIACRVFAIIESALGVANLREIAAFGGRLAGLMFGAEDLSGSLGAVRRPHAPEIDYARSAVVIHAKAFGLDAIDTPYVNIHDLDGLKQETHTAMQMGYDGKLCIHPKHIAPIMETFAPSADELAAAQALIAAHEQHQRDGSGVFAYNGKMVDRPMIRAAERIVQRGRVSD